LPSNCPIACTDIESAFLAGSFPSRAPVCPIFLQAELTADPDLKVTRRDSMIGRDDVFGWNGIGEPVMSAT